MTREQAIQLLGNVRVPWQRSTDIMQTLVEHPDRWVEAFVALGMLKLDDPPKPRTPSDLARDVITNYLSASAADSVLGLLEQNGLKVALK